MVYRNDLSSIRIRITKTALIKAIVPVGADAQIAVGVGFDRLFARKWVFDIDPADIGYRGGYPVDSFFV